MRLWTYSILHFACSICMIYACAHGKRSHPSMSLNLPGNFSASGTASRRELRSSGTRASLLAGAQTPLPFTLQPTTFTKCNEGNASCTSNTTKTLANETLNDHQDRPEWCALWDNSCTGNKSLAMDDIYDRMMWPAMACVQRKDDFACDQVGNLGGLSHVQDLESWMRSPKCLSTSSLWAEETHRIYSVFEFDSGVDSCCGSCKVYGNRVDLFYWPEENADDSCLSIVGSTVNSIDAGATTSTFINWNGNFTSTYWGCQARTITSDSSIITTAFLSTMRELTFKVSLANPWDPPDCVGLSTPQTPSVPLPTSSNSQTLSDDSSQSINLQPLVTPTGVGPVTTVVFEGFTL